MPSYTSVRVLKGLRTPGPILCRSRSPIDLYPLTPLLRVVQGPRDHTRRLYRAASFTCIPTPSFTISTFLQTACTVSWDYSILRPGHVICSRSLRRLRTMPDVTEGSPCAKLFRMQRSPISRLTINMLIFANEHGQ
jgi:hypothetical protein